MVHDVVTDRLGLGVQLHDGLLEDLHLLVNVRLLHVHARGLLLSRLERGLQHYVLLLETLLVGLDFVFPLLEELLLTLALLELFVEFLGNLLLATCLVTDTSDLRLYLKNFIVLLFDELLDSLESLISLLHAEERLLPILKQSLLAHHDLLDFNSSLLKSVPGGCGLLLL